VLSRLLIHASIGWIGGIHLPIAGLLVHFKHWFIGSQVFGAAILIENIY
jgi:hypothetical protein